jgi:hypothetical protein
MHARRIAVGALAGIGALVVAASTAWACVSGPVVNLSTVQAKPGEQVTVTGTGFRQADPVHIRWNALDGPIVAQMARPENQLVNATFAVPPGTAPGNYVVIVTQAKPDGQLSQSPIRAVLTVVGPSGQSPVVGADPSAADVDRLPDLVRADEGVSSGTLMLVALGVAGLGMFSAGIAALIASRRETTAVPAVAKR